MKKLLVLGGSGFVGGHVAVKGQGDWKVSATFRDRPFRLPGVTSVHLDINRSRSLRKVFEKIKPDAVIHTVAWSGLERCEEDREGAVRVNVEGTWNVAELCREMECRLVFTSSDMVFDGDRGMYREVDSVRPMNIYGETKVMAERIIRTSGVNHAIARIALIYGQPETGSNSFSEKVISRLKQGEPMALYTDQTRTPILVQDLAEALLELAALDFRGTIHLGGAERVNRYEFGKRLAEVKGFSEDLLKPVTMDEIPTKAPRPKDVSLNTSVAKSVLRTPLLSYYEGLTFA